MVLILMHTKIHEIKLMKQNRLHQLGYDKQIHINVIYLSWRISVSYPVRLKIA